MNFSTFDHLPYRIYIRNKRQEIVYANKLVGDFFGFGTQNLLGKKYYEILKDESFIKHLENIDKLLLSGKADSFAAIYEFNRYYKKADIFKVIDLICEDEEDKFIATILVEISDAFFPNNALKLGGIVLYDPANRTIKFHDGKEVNLTKLENSLLFLLYEKHGEVASYDEIFLALDPYNTMNKTALKSLVLRLKKKLAIDAIQNVSMMGYRLINP